MLPLYRKFTRQLIPRISSASVGPTIEPRLSGPRGEATRAKQFLSLIAPLSSLLPVDITIVASDHDLGSWILGSDQRDLALARVHSALEEHAVDGKVGFGLNKVRYLGGSELKHLENRNRNGVTGWFVSRHCGVEDALADVESCSRLVMKTRLQGVGTGPWKTGFGKLKDWSLCLNLLVSTRPPASRRNSLFFH